MNTDQIKLIIYTSNETIKKEEEEKQKLIEREIKEQTGNICICNVSDIWCVRCYGEFDFFD